MREETLGTLPDVESGKPIATTNLRRETDGKAEVIPVSIYKSTFDNYVAVAVINNKTYRGISPGLQPPGWSAEAIANQLAAQGDEIWTVDYELDKKPAE